MDLKAMDLEAMDLEAMDLEAMDLKAMDLKAVGPPRMELASPEREVSPSGDEEAGRPIARLQCCG
ncbi:MAG: hypothetical protein BRD53_04475 [Bacteroidetes bacterium SW_7_64_58]|nr:MAG: hypothetical protein BRD53_04475 [Bacteroidetes bacterium SW_7_64_58]